MAEGVDIPSVDAIVFADPTRSVIRCVQALGRALR
ncbi:helicase-related protein [Streptomyces californicus]